MRRGCKKHKSNQVCALRKKNPTLFCVLISLFPVKTFSEFATKFLFNSRVKTLSTKLSPKILQKIPHIKNVMILYIVEYFSQLVYDWKNMFTLLSIYNFIFHLRTSFHSQVIPCNNYRLCKETCAGMSSNLLQSSK